MLPICGGEERTPCIFEMPKDADMDIGAPERQFAKNE